MFVMSRTLIVEEKMDQLNRGYNAYAETKDVINLLEREIEEKQLSVICEKTDHGCWFTPDFH